MIPLHRNTTAAAPIALPRREPTGLPRPGVALPAKDPRSFRAELANLGAVERERIAESSRRLVADALVAPILAQFRSSMGQLAGKDSLFGVSEAEKRLGPVLDGHVADSIVERSALPLAKRVEQYLLDRAKREAAKGPSGRTRVDRLELIPTPTSSERPSAWERPR